MNEQTEQPIPFDVYQIAAAFQSIADAAAQFVEACQQAWDAICDIVADVAQAISRIWRQWRASHLIPRQYRDTMARRKIRRYILYLQSWPSLT